MAKRETFPPADIPPVSADLTTYDYAHFPLYCYLLDGVAMGCTWHNIPPGVLGIDPSQEPERAQQVFDANLQRARWMTVEGWKLLLDLPKSRH